MYALIKNNSVVKYPYWIADLKRDNPQISFPATPSSATMASFGVHIVFNNPEPAVTSTQVAEQSTPIFSQENQRWEQVWSVRAATAEEIAQRQQQLQDSIVMETQARLDDFAKTRNYDGILSACTYATSAVPKFQTEGQYAVQARDTTWAKLYKILAEVEVGTRPVPAGYAEVESELPPLAWPV